MKFLTKEELKFEHYRNDISWSVIFRNPKKLDYIRTRFSGYDDANWWNNVMPQKKEIEREIDGQKFKFIIDYENNTCDIYTF